MTSAIANLPSAQITVVARSGGAAPFCCNDPGCSCQGGKAAKAALDRQQQDDNLNVVRISAQAQQLLASERNEQSGPPISATAIPPTSASVPVRFPDAPFRLPDNVAVAASSETNAYSLQANQQLDAYRQIERAAEAANPALQPSQRIDNYA